MRRLSTLCFAAVTLLSSPIAAVEVMGVSELVSGTSGTCLTEMDGGELVEIPLTILGTAGANRPEGEIVLVRLDDERFARTGIIAGMSGSPVYVDGKLLGALAFGWSFATEPIAGVTPFARMRDLAEPSAMADGRATGGGERPELGRLLASWRDGSIGRVVVDWLLPEARDGLTALPVSVAVGGLGAAAAAEWIAESWRRLGWVSTPGGSAAAVAPESDLAPGAMIAGVLVEGDATLAVGGTVTEVRGDEVWAFGHPFLSGGAMQFPMARAQVITVLPSQLVSFKFFSVGREIGSLKADRWHGVWGRLGPSVPLVPITVDATGHEYAFRCVRHPVLLPLLAGYLAEASHSAHGRTFGDQTVRVAVEVRYEGDQEAGFAETFAGFDASSRAAGVVTALMAYLENSAFTAPEIEGVSIRLEAEERLAGAQLIEAVPERRVVRPGDVLGVRVRLQPHRGEVLTHRLEVAVPKGLAAGPIDLVVADGASWSVYDLRMRPQGVASFSDEIRMLGRLVPSTHIVAALERPDAGVAMSGGHVATPPGVLLTLRAALGSSLKTTAYGTPQVVREEMTYPVAGAYRVRLNVRLDQGGEEIVEGS